MIKYTIEFCLADLRQVGEIRDAGKQLNLIYFLPLEHYSV